MIRRILDFLADPSSPGGAAENDDGAEERQVAVAALLIEAAFMDEHFEAGERAKIAELLKSAFGLGEAETGRLIDEAEQEVHDSSQLFRFTRVVNQRFSQEDRIELMQMLWEVAYVDGELHDYEAGLMRRIAGLIHVTDQDSGAARKRALDRLGIEG